MLPLPEYSRKLLADKEASMQKNTASLARRTMSLSILLIFALSFFLTVKAQVDAGEKPTSNNGTDLIWGVKIPMRDGIMLNATVYKPNGMDAPLPVIVTGN